MKQLSVMLCMAAVVLTAACNNNKPKETAPITIEDGKEKVTIDPNQMQNVADAMEKTREELGKLTPLSLDQLKALIPETLMGAKRTNYSVSSSSGTGVANGEFQLNDSTRVTLTVIDCAGPGGAGIYSMQYLSLMNIQQESEEEYTKTIDINGGKGFEHCNKQSNDCQITYLSGERFLITLDGDNVGAPALKEVVSQLKIK